jgi:O-antigen/teichoic acid export membrane protein
MATVAQVRRSIGSVFVSPQSVRSRLARNTIWSIAGSASSQGGSLLAALMLGRLLGVARFGELAFIQVTVLMLGNLGEMGFSLTTTKFVSRWRSSDPARAGRLMGWSLRATSATALVSAAILALAGPHFAGASLKGLSGELRAACGLLIFDMLNRIQLGAFAGLEAFDSAARVQVSRGLLMLPCVWLGARYGGLRGAILAMGFVSLGTFLIGHRVLAGKCRAMSIPLGYRGGLEPGVLNTSLSLWFCGLLMTGSNWAVMVLLTRQPLGFSQVGLFNAADKWKTALLFLPQMLFQVILPMLSNRHAAGDRRGCQRIVWAALGVTAVIMGLAGVLVSSLSHVLMSSYGPAFAAGAGVLSLAAASAVVSAFYTVSSGALWALGKPSQMLGIDLLKTALLLGLCGAGLAASAWDLTLAYVLSYAAGSIVILLAVRNQLALRKA